MNNILQTQKTDSKNKETSFPTIKVSKVSLLRKKVPGIIYLYIHAIIYEWLASHSGYFTSREKPLVSR
jgi:hypothetical protein